MPCPGLLSVTKARGGPPPALMHSASGSRTCRSVRQLADISAGRARRLALTAGCLCGDLGSAAGVQLAHDVADMRLDGAGREVQPRGYLLIGHACRDQSDDV